MRARTVARHGDGRCRVLRNAIRRNRRRRLEAGRRHVAPMSLGGERIIHAHHERVGLVREPRSAWLVRVVVTHDPTATVKINDRGHRLIRAVVAVKQPHRHNPNVELKQHVVHRHAARHRRFAETAKRPVASAPFKRRRIGGQRRKGCAEIGKVASEIRVKSRHLRNFFNTAFELKAYLSGAKRGLVYLSTYSVFCF